IFFFFFFKQKTAYEMRISDWSSDVCSSDLVPLDGILRLAEGVEDAASVMNLLEPGRFVWPVLGIERYQAVAIPESVHTVVIYSQHGAEAARAIERVTPH